MTDQVNPDLFSEASIKVLVLDVNDNPPEFEQSSYKATLQESVQVGEVITQVKATSLDIGLNAHITYSLAAGNEQGKFAIDPHKGMKNNRIRNFTSFFGTFSAFFLCFFTSFS